MYVKYNHFAFKKVTFDTVDAADLQDLQWRICPFRYCDFY